MKRLLLSLLVLLPLVSCREEEPSAPAEKDTAFVSIEAYQTKTQMGTNSLPAWSVGDKIAVVGDDDEAPAEFVLRSGAGYSSASFEGRAPEGKSFIVCHPSTARCDGITFRGVLDAKVSHSMPSQALGTLPLWGRAKNLSEVKVSGICGILRLELKGSGRIKSIVLDAGKPVSGQFLCNIKESVFAMIGGANIIVMDAPDTELVQSEATPFCFILPPGEYEDLRFTFTTEDSEVLYYTVEDVLTVDAGFFTTHSVNLNDLL